MRGNFSSAGHSVRGNFSSARLRKFFLRRAFRERKFARRRSEQRSRFAWDPAHPQVITLHTTHLQFIWLFASWDFLICISFHLQFIHAIKKNAKLWTDVYPPRIAPFLMIHYVFWSSWPDLSFELKLVFFDFVRSSSSKSSSSSSSITFIINSN